MPATSRTSLVALMVTLPCPAVRTSVGLIDRVVTEGTAIRVLFSRSGSNITGGAGSQGRFVIGHDDITWLSGPKSGKTESGLLFSKDC
jgi:hypothetical protein